MDRQKVCFISCVNDEDQYARAVSHIDMLYPPKGVTVEKVAIRHAKSMASGYNEAMEKSDARYKVYIRQNTMIINRMFLHDLLFLFEQHPDLGMFGVIGAKDLPASGNWWDSPTKAGKMLEHRHTYSYLSFLEAEYAYQQVEAIDGALMATQYDLPWPEVVDGWHVYDTVQSLKFQQAGFKVGVPHQPHPWVLHESALQFDESPSTRSVSLFQKWRDSRDDDD